MVSTLEFGHPSTLVEASLSMKVLHVIPSVAPIRGGPSCAVLAMVKALRAQGIDAEIATTNDKGPDLLDVPLRQRLEYEQVPVWFFPRLSPAIASIREFALSGHLTSWFWRNVSAYDVLHVHAIFSYPSTVAMAIARLQGIPYIVRPLGQLCKWSLQQSGRKKQLYLNLIERANLDGSQALHFTSQQEQQEATCLGLRSPSFIVPHGLNLSAVIPNARSQLRQMLQVPEDEPVILFLSRLHPKKGLDYLIPALGKLSEQRFTFVLAGNGSSEYEAEVDALLVTAGIRDRTYRAGFVAGVMKDLFLQGADLFALTSHSENFGMAVLEALAAGLPVLVTPGVALASVVEQYHLGYVSQLDSKAIAFTLKHFLSYPQKAIEMGDRARRLILDKYTWDPIATRMIQVYTTILHGKPIQDLP
jgi:glycosyltransferase involved in cell wall biosynthesis